MTNSLTIVKDEDGTARLAHHVNPTTGKYKGRQVLKAKKDMGTIVTEVEA